MKRYSWFSNLLYVLKDVRAYSRWGIVALFAAIIFTLAEAIMGTLTSSLIVKALTSGSTPSAYLGLIGALAGATLVCTILKIWGVKTFEWKSTFTRCSTEWLRLTEKTINTDYLNIEPREKRSVFEKAWQALDSNWVGLEMTMKQAPTLFIGALGILIYAVIASIYVPWILLVMAAMVVTSALWTAWGYAYLKKRREVSLKNYVQSDMLRRDSKGLENAKDIRAYHLDRWFDQVYVFLAKQIFSEELKASFHMAVGEVSDCFFLFARDLLAYTILIPQVVAGTIDLATFTFLVGIIAGFSTWVNSAIGAFNRAKRNSLMVDDYRNALAVKDVFNHGAGPDVKSLQKPFEITFDHVCFTYPGSDKETLHDVNLVIHPGERIALVGNNGAGKTTLIKLLCGLYQPTAGRILLNGIDIQQFNNEDYMSLISALFQDVKPLAFTLKINVACCPEDAVDEARFSQAISAAGLAEKIASLPQKENTFISQQFDLSGVQLSGGEVQKLLLARALYKGAPLLVLDEPTAALDPLSEEAMYKQYLRFAEGNTSIFISHRLASTRFCDRIFYLDDGRIEESGTHEELIRQNKKYKEMFDIQAKYYQEEDKADGNI